MHPKIAIVSVEGDLHALAVEATLRKSKQAEVHLLHVDRLCNTTDAVWRLPVSKPRIRDAHGDEVPLDELGAIWWRRFRTEQKFDQTPADKAQLDLINNDWWAFFKGLLLTSHRGMWISHPEATDRASIKLWQLKKAAECGFRIPRTLASNDPAEVRQFLTDVDGVAVVKPIMGTRLKQLFTQLVDVARLDDECIRIVPALYQEFIPGDIHLRLNVFGCSVYAASIMTSAPDWRPNLNVPVSSYTVDPALEKMLIHSLRAMDLEMGIVDIKLLPSGEPVWLEINPQGQFLFLENLSYQNLLHHFCEFLIASADYGAADASPLISTAE
jgi:glutathione synthase/RimK-type ligase-like ATP-grasp enzyme